MSQRWCTLPGVAGPQRRQNVYGGEYRHVNSAVTGKGSLSRGLPGWATGMTEKEKQSLENIEHIRGVVHRYLGSLEASEAAAIRAKFGIRSGMDVAELSEEALRELVQILGIRRGLR